MPLATSFRNRSHRVTLVMNAKSVMPRLRIPYFILINIGLFGLMANLGRGSVPGIHCDDSKQLDERLNIKLDSVT